MTETTGRIITFYSYKGGTGRSMAVANAAWVLASNGHRVLMVDWDLEAPGLHRYFHPFLIDKKLNASPGLIDMVLDFSNAVMSRPEAPDSDGWYLRYTDLREYAISLDWKFDRKGALDLIPAGKQDESYASRVTSFDWENFYSRLGGGVFLESVREEMRKRYDYVLIDSRTGVSDTSGICTVHMPDQLVVCFTLNTQSIEGASAVANSVARQREEGFRIFPVPMRVEDGEKPKRDRGLDLAKKKFLDLLGWLGQEEWLGYWGAVKVPYKTFYAYEETLATFADTPLETDTVLAAIEALLGFLAGAEMRLRAPNEDLRRKILDEFERKEVSAPPPRVDAAPLFKIFFSHDRKDGEYANAIMELFSALFAERVMVVSSAGSIVGQIREQITSCDLVVVILGDREVSSLLNQEIGMASALGKRLLTVTFADEPRLPETLSEIQTRSGKQGENMLDLLEDLNHELNVYPETVFSRMVDPLLEEYLSRVYSPAMSSDVYEQQRQTLDAPVSDIKDISLQTSAEITADNHPRFEDDEKEHHGPWVVTRGTHSLTLPPLYRLGLHPVTNALYLAFVEDGGYLNDSYWDGGVRRNGFVTDDMSSLGPATWPSSAGCEPARAHHPVCGICFEEARAFCLWLRQRRPRKDGLTWCLPTEDMWEWAARRPDGRIYPWGNSFEYGRCNSRENGIGETSPVDAFPTGASVVGCLDMVGNVWEFVQAPDVRKRFCVLRGGGFKNNQQEVKTTLRLHGVPRNHRPD
ncbi:MAG: SUMF1/EgtB/PvdO family nonheme iron enzyme, partial [Chromatiales bacterium]